MMSWRSRSTALGALAVIALAAQPALAQPAMRVGHALRDAGEPYSMSGKSQAKAAFVDGAWWAVLSSAKGMDLMRLQGTTWVQETISGGTHISNDPNMRADVVFDGTHLIVLGTNNTSIKLWVFNYTRPSFRLVSGYPVNVAGGSSSDPVATDMATVAEDSRGRLWVAYRAGTQGFVKASGGVGTSGWLTWKAPVQIGYLGNGIAEESSNNAIVAFTDDGGPKIGVVWADQSDFPTNAYRFRWRRDSATSFTINDWQPEELIYTNPGEEVANDQLSVVAFEKSIYVAAKSDTTPTTATVGQDRFYLFVRDETGAWTKNTMRKIERNGDTATRPEIVIDGEHRLIYAFWHDFGIEGKITSVDRPNFLGASLVSFISPSNDTNWDAQSTHQIVNSRTDLLVLADDNDTGWQYWNVISLGTPEASNPVPTLSSITVNPSIAVTTSNGQVQFTATGRDQHGQLIDIQPGWSTNGGSIDSTGLYTATSVTGVYGVAATQSETGHATVFVNDAQPVLASIEIQPDPSTIQIGSQEQLSVVGRTPTGQAVALSGIPVAWAVVNGVGSISTTGLYSAPSSENRAFVQATASNLTAFATILVVPQPPSGGGSGGSGGGGGTTIGPLARIVVTPASPTLAPNGTLQFSVQGQDAAGHTVSLGEVQWTASSGTITATGFFTAPSAPGSATITASSGGVTGSTTATIQNSSTGFSGGGGGGHGGGGCEIAPGHGSNPFALIPLATLAFALVVLRRRG